MNGERLKRIMKANGLTNNDVATRMGTTAQNLSAALAKEDIKTGFLERFAEALGTTPAELYGGSIMALASVPCSGFQREYRDIFLLIFCLLGINITDLFNLRPSDYSAGRIRYRRAKTGRLYDVRVWPAAASLLERYRGHHHLLCFADRYASSRDYTQHINAGLKKMFPAPPFSSLSTYWARHTWASLAYNELGASVDDISAALGHQYGSRITAVYIDPDSRKVDDLNRRMLELLFSPG